MGHFFKNFKLVGLASCIMFAAILPIQIFSSYNRWVTVALVAGIGIVVYGVLLLALKVPVAVYVKDNYLKKNKS